MSYELDGSIDGLFVVAAFNKQHFYGVMADAQRGSVNMQALGL